MEILGIPKETVFPLLAGGLEGVKGLEIHFGIEGGKRHVESFL